MTPGRNRVRVRDNIVFGGDFVDGLPDPPENPEFLEYPQDFQDRVAARIDAGITLGALKAANARRAVQQSHQDCAKRFRDAALHRANTATIGDAVRTDARRRRERRNGGAR